tara:strand:- start:1025 stop:1234 length:210 start_codon:yes stop_codon:yes gene_type:complete
MKTINKDARKVRAQVKSRWYYFFWGTATVAVVAGQIYVGTGYRLMSGAFHRIMDSIAVEFYSDQYPVIR